MPDLPYRTIRFPSQGFQHRGISASNFPERKIGFLPGNLADGYRCRSCCLTSTRAKRAKPCLPRLISFLFDRSTLSLKETAVIDMMLIVAAILPSLLVVAALSAQFSAAVADTSGSGGLIAELTNGRVNAKQSYGLLVLFGLILTWSSDVFEIVS